MFPLGSIPLGFQAIHNWLLAICLFRKHYADPVFGYVSRYELITMEMHQVLNLQEGGQNTAAWKALVLGW